MAIWKTFLQSVFCESPRRFRWEGVLFVILIALGLHLQYSHLGFNPTDEGYLLSGSRRLLDGEVPHRDFISLRPIGTHLFHAHLLLWAGDHLILWSRFFVCLQFAAIGWFWVRIAEHFFEPLPSPWVRWSVGLIGMMFAAHVFPLMPWNSIDGVFFISLGVFLRSLAPARFQWLGLAVIGMAPLFRQNFIFTLPLAVIILGDQRKLCRWMAVLFPGVAYGLALIALGALPDALIQMGSHSSSLAGAVLPSPGVSRQSLVAGMLAGTLAFALMRLGRNLLTRRSGLVILILGFVFSMHCVFCHAGGRSWLAFGLLLAAIPFYARAPQACRGFLLPILLAWSVSISEGWHLPTLGAAGLAAAFFASLWMRNARCRTGMSFSSGSGLMAVILCITLGGFHWARTHRIYCDAPAEDLRCSLTGVFRGAGGIYTNQTTHDYLVDLREVIRWSQGRKASAIAVLPETAQYWVSSSQRNPLSSDWPIDAELSIPGLRDRLFHEIEGARNHTLFLVQKYQAEHLCRRLEPYRDGTCRTRDLVRGSFKKVYESNFFEVYE